MIGLISSFILATICSKTVLYCYNESTRPLWSNVMIFIFTEILCTIVFASFPTFRHIVCWVIFVILVIDKFKSKEN